MAHSLSRSREGLNKEIAEKLKLTFESPVAIAIVFLGIEPTIQQAKFLLSKKRRIAFNGTTLSGKTTLIITKAIYYALNTAGKSIIIVTKNVVEKERMKLLLRTILGRDKHLSERFVGTQADLFSFDTGSRIKISERLDISQRTRPDNLLIDDALENDEISKLRAELCGNLDIAYRPEEGEYPFPVNETIKVSQMDNPLTDLK